MFLKMIFIEKKLIENNEYWEYLIEDLTLKAKLTFSFFLYCTEGIFIMREEAVLFSFVFCLLVLMNDTTLSIVCFILYINQINKLERMILRKV